MGVSSASADSVPREPCRTLQECRNEIVRLEGAVTWQRQRAVARWPGDAAAAIILACRTTGTGAARCDEARRVALCESRMNPRAKNRHSSAAGLFQFLDSTWRRQGYPAFSVYDPYLNALAALRIRAHDGSWRQWECQP